MNQNPYSSQEMSTFEEHIKKKIVEIESKINSMEGQYKNQVDSHENLVSYGDDAKDEQMLSKLGILIENQATYLQKLKMALVRIENGTYGIDSQTGEKIAKERLLAEPTATTNL